MTDTTTPAPTDDLQKRCAEIIGWHRTGVLVGDALRSHAESKWPGAIRNLQMAERATENEALCLIAKWGAPAPASGAAEAGLRALADRIEEAQGRAICISVEGADYLRNALAASAAVAPAPAPASGELVAEVMFDERKYIQYTIPLELLPVGAKFYTAQEARVPLTSEQQRCIAEAHNVAACEEYFNARPQIDYISNRRIFEAGFSKGYGITAAQKETP